MSDQYYDNEVLNTSVLVEGVVWQQLEAGQSYQNDSFLTVDDSCNETQYFSLLDSCGNNTILNDISGISELNGYDETACAVNAAASNLFRIEGSEDIFGYDIALDDEGNLRRYRYRLRLNDNGEYEGDPESIELVNFDDDEYLDTCMVAPEQVMAQQVLVENSYSTPIKTEMILAHESIEHNDVPDEDSNGLQVNEDTDCDEALTFIDHDDGYESCSRLLDSKIGIIENQTLLPIHKVESVSHCKREAVQSYEHFSELVHDSFNANNDHIEQARLSALDDTSLVLQNQDGDVAPETNIVQTHHVYLSDINEHDEPVETSLDRDNDKNCSSPSTLGVGISDESESDVAEYEVVDGMHVTGDCDAPTAFEQLEEPLSPPYVLQLPQQTSALPKKVYKNPKINYSKNPEKENLAVVPQINLVKTNPRSLLKSSYVFIEQNDNETEQEASKIDKRFFKNKEFLQARLFSNYIAQTTILHAPVRQKRLPRKQTFVPVERTDEEIIVQEVVVSSKGFVETTEDGVIKSKVPLKATEIVQLSDSDDDYRPRRKKRLKKKAPKAVEIIISDSDDEENTLQSNVNDSDDISVKKKRGRPFKTTANTSDTSVATEIQERNSRTWWNCEHCPKSFPNQTTLNSHIAFHKPKYMCVHCNETFKNNILLGRHLNIHNDKNQTYQCATCNKKCPDQIDLTKHTRMHMKDFLVRATMFLKHSPKSTNKSPPKSNACHFCSKSFSSGDLLKMHQKTHMQFSCANCPLKFASKLMLESHVRNNCVKSSWRKSYIPRLVILPKRRSDSFKPPQSSSTKDVLSCDNCTNKFSSYANLYKHKILVHNPNTLDKTQIIKDNIFNKRASHKAHSNTRSIRPS